jgi:hypothetical protein
VDTNTTHFGLEELALDLDEIHRLATACLDKGEEIRARESLALQMPYLTEGELLFDKAFECEVEVLVEILFVGDVFAEPLERKRSLSFGNTTPSATLTC